MISVCLATYNGVATLHQQLSSILAQLSPDDEVIISDDGSTDGTLNVVRAFNSPIVRIVQGPGTGSPIQNFEHALQQARGEYIFLSDQDDLWLEGKVQHMVAALKAGADCVVSDCHVTDDALNVTAPSFFAHARLHEGRWYNLFMRNFYLGCCMAFNRRVLLRSLPFASSFSTNRSFASAVTATTSPAPRAKAPIRCGLR